LELWSLENLPQRGQKIESAPGIAMDPKASGAISAARKRARRALGC
jgi:hypothetical protein